jgi:hypothetical protein
MPILARLVASVLIRATSYARPLVAIALLQSAAADEAVHSKLVHVGPLFHRPASGRSPAADEDARPKAHAVPQLRGKIRHLSRGRLGKLYDVSSQMRTLGLQLPPESVALFDSGSELLYLRSTLSDLQIASVRITPRISGPPVLTFDLWVSSAGVGEPSVILGAWKGLRVGLGNLTRATSISTPGGVPSELIIGIVPTSDVDLSVITAKISGSVTRGVHWRRIDARTSSRQGEETSLQTVLPDGTEILLRLTFSEVTNRPAPLSSPEATKKAIAEIEADLAKAEVSKGRQQQ